jgi:glucosylceramidase
MASSAFLLVFALLGFRCHAAKMQTVQTAYNEQHPDLLKSLPEVDMAHVDSTPTENALIVDRSVKYQEMLGFGGAFTEASAVNWMKLSAEDRDKVMHLYFADPSDGGHGYTMGRVPMGSCDFTVSSYSFNNVSGDTDMEYFDNSVAHDESSGMLPMMRAAQELVQKRNQSLNIFASPWSPPAWMKNAQGTDFKMTGSALPVGLNMKYADAYSKYFSKFITAYKNKGINLWGVTPQNEPEFAAAWEGCVYTPEYEAEFVGNHLGPLLHQDHPGLKIIGYDHNKDHVVAWAQGLYQNDSVKQYIDGIGVHWYGGLNTQNMNTTHHIAPDKFILATEACNCGGVVFKNDTQNWWSRAEKLAIDILEDIKWWSAGWIDWNLVLNTAGGPNHLGNLCDANIIADPNKVLGGDTLIMHHGNLCSW